MTIRERSELAEDLRWLADQWRKASPVMRARIERAYAKGKAAA